MKKIFLTVAILVIGTLVGCVKDTTANTYNTKNDIKSTSQVADSLAEKQPTPADINYSLERYNLIRRAYWVNGQREKANTLICEIEKPLGHIVLFTDNGAVVGKFIVDGKVSSLNSYLTPDSEFYEQEYGSNGHSYGDGNNWLADVDGSYGENDNGIFFFTPDGKYVEWTGTYLYSDIPFEISDPVIRVEG
ncbi:MAG: hypothetical protein J6J23_00220 [Clostridia bacterium]|nr:hypothetical protein [Clostridia bacterium]